MNIDKHFGIQNLSEAIYTVSGVSIFDICGRSKRDNVNYSRKVYIYVLMNDFGISIDGIAALTQRDRTSIYWYVHNMSGWLKWDKKFSIMLKSVKNQANRLYK